MCCPHHQEDTSSGINLFDKQKNNKIGAPPYSRRFSARLKSALSGRRSVYCLSRDTRTPGQGVGWSATADLVSDPAGNQTFLHATRTPRTTTHTHLSRPHQARRADTTPSQSPHTSLFLPITAHLPLSPAHTSNLFAPPRARTPIDRAKRPPPTQAPRRPAVFQRSSLFKRPGPRHTERVPCVCTEKWPLSQPV